MPRPSLLGQGKAEIHHQRRAGQGDKEAEAGEAASYRVDLSDLGFDVLPLRFSHRKSARTRECLDGRSQLSRQLMRPIQLGPAVARSREPDDVDAAVADYRTQVGQRNEQSRPERVGAGPLGLGDVLHSELDHLTGTDGHPKPVTAARLQCVGQRSRDQHLVRSEVLAHCRRSVLQPVGAEGGLSSRVKPDQHDQGLGIVSIEVDHRARQLDAGLHPGERRPQLRIGGQPRCQCGVEEAASIGGHHVNMTPGQVCTARLRLERGVTQDLHREDGDSSDHQAKHDHSRLPGPAHRLPQSQPRKKWPAQGDHDEPGIYEHENPDRNGGQVHVLKPPRASSVLHSQGFDDGQAGGA